MIGYRALVLALKCLFQVISRALSRLGVRKKAVDNTVRCLGSVIYIQGICVVSWY